MRTGGLAALAMATAALLGCDDDQPGAATELAPSQISAATVPEPTGVSDCDAGDLTFQSVIDGVQSSAGDGVAAVIRIANDGPARCEVDVSRSPLADPLMEPDVWIEPGGQAELLVEHDGATCDAPAPVAAIELRVNGATVDVPVDVEATCGVLLTAVYAVEPGG